MMDCAFFFRATASSDAMRNAIEECNQVLLEDFGPDHELLPEHAPDLLVVCRDPWTNKAIGLLTLHHTPETRAWEMGTMSANAMYSHTFVLDEIMRETPAALMRTMQEDTAAAWIVMRVKKHDKRRIARLARLGLEAPKHFLIGVLSNEGYIPFDPFDEVLLKLRLCPPALVRLEMEQRSAHKQLAGLAHGGGEEPAAMTVQAAADGTCG